GAERPRIPGLLPEPGHGGQAVVVLIGPERVERAARAEGATAALDDGLEPPLGEHPPEHQTPAAPAPVRRTDQDQRWWRPQPPQAGPRCVPVGEQDRPIWHPDPQVTLDVDVAAGDGRQPEGLP